MTHFRRQPKIWRYSPRLDPQIRYLVPVTGWPDYRALGLDHQERDRTSRPRTRARPSACCGLAAAALHDDCPTQSSYPDGICDSCTCGTRRDSSAPE